MPFFSFLFSLICFFGGFDGVLLEMSGLLGEEDFFNVFLPLPSYPDRCPPMYVCKQILVMLASVFCFPNVILKASRFSLLTKLQNTRSEKIYKLIARPPLYTLSSGANFSSTDLPIFGSASSKSPSLYECSVAVPPNIPSSVSFHAEAIPPTSQHTPTKQTRKGDNPPTNNGAFGCHPTSLTNVPTSSLPLLPHLLLLAPAAAAATPVDPRTSILAASVASKFHTYTPPSKLPLYTYLESVLPGGEK